MKDKRKDRRQLRRMAQEKSGYQTLAVDIVTEKGLLEPVQEE